MTTFGITTSFVGCESLDVMRSVVNRVWSTVPARLRRLPQFSIVGATVTLFATTSNIILLKYFRTPLILTYICIYGVSISFSYLLNSRFTFNSELSTQRMAAYFAIYLSAMALGVFLLKIYRAVLPFENWVLPLLVLPFTALWNFTLSSVVLKAREER